ncbi:hypothetical protein [Corynebacterium freiburgense]|uniref:hypothetical protein n=1 Tax=Corynebacterium freiburgense TaxID=556548 RepID=UPI0003F78A57|nr:hypothetical protein [Corynebacterium freiburgense]WJZ03923.1 hypothetical protein CFREI_13375 [Corynebacterium freiburgense]
MLCFDHPVAITKLHIHPVNWLACQEHSNNDPCPRGDRGQVEEDVQEGSNDAPTPSDTPPTVGTYDDAVLQENTATG